MEGCKAVLWTHSCPSTYVLVYTASTVSTYSKNMQQKAKINKNHHHVRHRGVNHDFHGYCPLRWFKLNNLSIP